MKKILTGALLAFALIFAAASEASAQVSFGVTGGATFSRLSKEVIKGENMTQYHVGGTVQISLPLGFSIQPSLIYNVKGSRFSLADTPAAPSGNVTVGYLEVPVSLQWGPDLLLFRPFLDVTPFVGYGLNNRFSISGMETVKNSWDGSSVNRWEYGVGIGIGLEIWKFQVIGRYNWNFGSLLDFSKDLGDGGFGPALRNSFERGNFGGFTLTAAILF